MQYTNQNDFFLLPTCDKGTTACTIQHTFHLRNTKEIVLKSTSTDSTFRPNVQRTLHLVPLALLLSHQQLQRQRREDLKADLTFKVSVSSCVHSVPKNNTPK